MRDVAANERRTSWRLGPACDDLAKALVAADLEPALDTMHAVRRRVLLSRASMLQVLAGQGRGGDEATSTTPMLIAAPIVTPVVKATPKAEPRSEAVDQSASLPEPAGTAAQASIVDGVTFFTLTEDFLRKKMRSMGDHSRRQYRGAARLFVKLQELMIRVP